VVQDLLSFGHGLDLAGREVTAPEVGRAPTELGLPVVAVVRDGRTLHYDAAEATPLRRGDHILFVGSTAVADGVGAG
jgi:voltage-gated potassium channel